MLKPKCQMSKLLIVGLGNPGGKYKRTRHNVGFRVLEEFQKENDFPTFKLVRKFNSLISKGEFSGKKILLAKPQTFMNNSGQAVKLLIRNKKAMAKLTRIENLWVVHDDIDLPLGKIRISKGRGPAGHKGVESIIKELGTKNFVRIRVGIQPKTGKPKNPEKFVIQKFTKEEEKTLKSTIKKISQALKTTLTQGLQKAMTEFNK